MTHQRRRTIVVNVRREDDLILNQLIECLYKVFPPEDLAEIGYDPESGYESLRIT